MTRFIDYFFICGLSETKKPQLYKINDEEIASVFGEKRLVASVLCHFPKEVSENPWNSAEIWKLCTPCGLAVFAGKAPPTVMPHFHSFVVTREDGSRCHGHVLAFYERCTNSMHIECLADLLQLQDNLDDINIYVEKCIGFITQLAWINTCEKILKTLFNQFVEEPHSITNGLPIESYIYNLLYEIPMLVPGNSFKLSCMGHENPSVVQMPSRTELPSLDIYLTQVTALVGGNKNLLHLLTSVFLEHKILLVSEDSQRLSLVGEGITSLLFPFQWQHTQVSVLPYELASYFFDAPVPYIIGVLVLPGQKDLIHQALEVDQCFVDLDEALVEVPEDQPCFPHFKELIKKFHSFNENYKREMHILSRKSMRSRDQSSPTPTDDVPENQQTSLLRTNETINRAADIAMKAGVIDSLDDIDSLNSDAASDCQIGMKLRVCERIFCEHRYNIAIRETIASKFLAMFFQYDKFVITPILDEHGLWTYSSETQDNFDKTSFLSDQPESRLPFLLPFLDTQMFATLIDNSNIYHQQRGHEPKEANLRLFDERIELCKVGNLDPHTPTSPEVAAHEVQLFRSVSITSYNVAHPPSERWIKETEQAVKKRLSKIDVLCCPPHTMSGGQLDNDVINTRTPGIFPQITGKLVESEAFEKTKKQLRRRTDPNRTAFKRIPSIREDSKWRKIQQSRSLILRQPSVSEYSPEVIAQSNWRFVKKLLKDVKQKTKKILVGKMGKEAVELGHGELSDSISNLEESTWIASFCDLLEKVWSHGLLPDYKKGKSALWSHLIQYQVEEEERSRKSKMKLHLSGSSPSLLEKKENHSSSFTSSPPIFSPSSTYNSLPRSFPRKDKLEIRQTAIDTTSSSSLNKISRPIFTLLGSIEKIQLMREIRTDVGRSRAWIRLVLERKELHPCLHTLLNNRGLLDCMYKKYSLLQCEDERVQFLLHLLSLDASEFTCFTSSYLKTIVEYRVWVVPVRQYGHVSQTTANVYMYISGESGRTKKILLSKGCLEFSFAHSNLGVLSTLVIGHDNAGMLPKWWLDYVIVQNQVTGQTLCFPCRRWLGKGTDDNSIERLLLAETVPRDTTDISKYANLLTQTIIKNSTNGRFMKAELQELVGQAVNPLVKYYFKSERERRLDVLPPPATFTKLLYNLVMALECVFTHGLKSGSIFKRRLFALDAIALCFETLRNDLASSLLINSANTPLDSEENNHIAAGGDWFLGNRRLSSHASIDQSSDYIRDSSIDASDQSRRDSTLAKEMKAFERMCHLYEKIASAGSKLGKDDIFYLIMLIGIHERALSSWLPNISRIAKSEGCGNLYQDHAFLCDKSSVDFMAQILTLVEENEVPLDSSLLRGFDQLLL